MHNINHLDDRNGLWHSIIFKILEVLHQMDCKVIRPPVVDFMHLLESLIDHQVLHGDVEVRVGFEHALVVLLYDE
jgi:hypothetical protein